MNDYEMSKLIKKILYFSIEERERYLKIFENSYVFDIHQLTKLYKKNDGDEILNKIMNNNQDWITYNIKLIEFELFKIKERIINEKPYKTIYEDESTLKRLEDKIVEKIYWFNKKLDYIYETRYSSKPCYFNEIEESKLFEVETKKINIEVSPLIKEMLMSLEKIINIINRGHCYFYEQFLTIESIETATPVIDEYLKIYNDYREKYFKELEVIFAQFKSDLRVYYPTINQVNQH